MSYFVCPHCGETSNIFHNGGAQLTADKYEVEFLGAIPLDIQIRETSDAGQPISATDPASPHAQAYAKIAEKVAASIEHAQVTQARQTPNISIE